MNTSAFCKGEELHTIDGHEAMQLVERSFWQSRMTANGRVAEPVEIIHPIEFLKESSNETSFE